MRDHIDLGCAPSQEDCAQVGRPDYLARARSGCRAYLNQLRRVFGGEPDGARLSIKSNPQEFGTYLSVVCHFDDQYPASMDYAFRCENQGPREWDEEGKRELHLHGSHEPKQPERS